MKVSVSEEAFLKTKQMTDIVLFFSGDVSETSVSKA